MSSNENATAAEEPQMEELDLTPYEEDDDATLHRKLVAAKQARKRAEEDLKLLCNRIGLLKNEEGKVSALFTLFRNEGRPSKKSTTRASVPPILWASVAATWKPSSRNCSVNSSCSPNKPKKQRCTST